MYVQFTHTPVDVLYTISCFPENVSTYRPKMKKLKCTIIDGHESAETFWSTRVHP